MSSPRPSSRSVAGPVPAAPIAGARLENAPRVEDDPQKLFTEACLHGLSARLREDVDALDSYLPPQVDKLARKVAEVLEEPQPAPA
ncbi:hypothetical protein [Streptomyces sp. 147326]|uniref:hypothetical protein n=1 Tax=Streptomyces sp. 147326 TaxID=3074379 RepID=UPI003857DB38